MNKKSKLQSRKECYICRILYGRSAFLPSDGLHLHHVFGAANRPISDREGLVVWLCPEHHLNSEIAAHVSKATSDFLKREGQRAFEEEHSREEFMELFGRNWL